MRCGVADRPVEDLVAGAGVRELDGVGVVDPERLREVVVGQGLVGEAVALLVHHDRRRRATAPLELGDGRAVAGDLGVEHHRGAPVRRHVAELGLGLDRHHQAVAGVAAGAEGEDLVAEVGLHQRRVPLEAAAGQHHALAGTDAGAHALVLDHDADHVAGVVGDDLLGRGLEQRLDAPLEQALEQPGDEGGALGADVLLLAALQLGLQLRALGQEVLGEGGGGAERHERAPLDDAVLPLGELVAHRVGVGLDRAAGLHLRAGEAPRPVVVGQRLDVGRQRGVVLEVAQHLGRGVDVDLEQLGVGLAAAADPAHVGEGLLLGVLHAGGLHHVVARQPHAAARHGGGAAEHRLLLDDQHLGPTVVGQGGGGQRRASRPDDDDVDDAIPRLGHGVSP